MLNAIHTFYSTSISISIYKLKWNVRKTLKKLTRNVQRNKPAFGVTDQWGSPSLQGAEFVLLKLL